MTAQSGPTLVWSRRQPTRAGANCETEDGQDAETVRTESRQASISRRIGSRWRNGADWLRPRIGAALRPHHARPEADAVLDRYRGRGPGRVRDRLPTRNGRDETGGLRGGDTEYH